jgi:hypothetical protein
MKSGQVRLTVCQDELLPRQQQLKNDICAIRAGQSKSEGRITVMLDKQLKGVTAIVKQQAQNLHKRFSSELRVTQ